MKTLSSTPLLPCLMALAWPALAQHGDPATASPTRVGSTVQRIAPRGDAASCDEARRHARYTLAFEQVDLEDVVQKVSEATCRTFLVPEAHAHVKLTLLGPDDGRGEVDAELFYIALLAALEANAIFVVKQRDGVHTLTDRRAPPRCMPMSMSPDEDDPYWKPTRP